MGDDFLRAVALMLVIEGILPFLSPAGFRGNLLRLAGLEDRSLRFFGLIAMLGGLLLLKLASA